MLNMGLVSRENCMAVGSGQILGSGGAKKITQLLNNYFAPQAADSVYQEVGRFDLLRRKTESNMQVGRASPEAFVSAICMQHAPLFRPEKSPVLASVPRNLGFQRLPDSCVDFSHRVVAQFDWMFWRRRMWMSVRTMNIMLYGGKTKREKRWMGKKGRR